ncbi:hypothetical protein [Shewanella woodyi]|uniref:hypothetical protein n=1 Tax=Shewanella woodyi TaxID=60961 RepID=UPI0007E9C0D5|nr:hypothetical protein [Shewanella woodyi]
MENNFNNLSKNELRALLDEKGESLTPQEVRIITLEISEREADSSKELDDVWTTRDSIPKWKSSFTSNLYTEKTVGFSAFIFGPLAGCYMIYRNYLLLNMQKKATIFLFISSILVVVLFYGIAITEGATSSGYNSVIPIVSGIFALFFVKVNQSKRLFELLSEPSATKASVLKVMTVGTTSFISLLILALPFSLLLPTMEGEMIEIGELQHEVFYDDSITEVKAQKVAEILEDVGVFDSEYQTYLKIEKSAVGYRILLPRFTEVPIEESKSYCLFLEFKLSRLYPNDLYEVKIFEDLFLERIEVDCK